jgi:dTDP-4-amino-4,6-dideoxy-D-galactose acyltransferase
MIGTELRQALVPLAWDSEFFGVPVARINATNLNDRELREVLQIARDDSNALIYWFTAPDRYLSSEILSEFQGTLVDRKVAFEAAVTVSDENWSARSLDLNITEYPLGPANPKLEALAISAGMYSRYKTDPYIPVSWFERLYTTWIQRSTARELADVVLVAGASPIDPVGMITIAANRDTASIGLIAVDEAVRGRGVGTSLMEAAHGWMRRQRARTATVVTQMANGSACGLYERCGYRLRDINNCFHFWPTAQSG